jgi:TPR repeat protein
MSARLFCVLGVACGLFISAYKASGIEPVSYRQAATLSLAERRLLNHKAERGDDKAAFALALYYASVVPNLKNREYFLILATKSGSRASIEALADFYSMPGGVFRLQKAISLRKELKSRFPGDVNNIDWAEGCAFEYHYITTAEARRKELVFLKLAASWGSSKAKDALKTIRIDSASTTDAAAAPRNRREPLSAVETNDFLRIPTDRISVLTKKAERGDRDAAERLGLYYGIYRNDKKRALHNLKLAAAKNSDVAIRNLITTYSTDLNLFNFTKALGFREKLKQIAEAKKIDVQPDADWSYDLYLEHFLASENKRLGIFFLKYAARQGSEPARSELIEIYANDSDLRNPKKARYWTKISDASKSAPPQTLALISNVPKQRPDHLPLDNPAPQSRVVINQLSPTEQKIVGAWSWTYIEGVGRIVFAADHKVRVGFPPDDKDGRTADDDEFDIVQAGTWRLEGDVLITEMDNRPLIDILEHLDPSNRPALEKKVERRKIVKVDGNKIVFDDGYSFDRVSH